MTTPEAALTAAIIGEPSISALIGNRFFPVGGRQQEPYPYATYQTISTQTAKHLDGDGDLDWPRFQITVWDKTSPGASAVADVIRRFLCPTPSVEREGAGLTFSATFEDQRGPTLDEMTRKYGCEQDYFIWHGRT